MLIDFKGNRALVTGAAHGIGRAIAFALARDGAHVTGVDNRDVEPTENGLTISVHSCDLTKRAAIDGLVNTKGPFDILVHSAGGVCGQVGRPLEEISEEDWDAIVDINMKAGFFLSVVTSGTPTNTHSGWVRTSTKTAVGSSARICHAVLGATSPA